jgi:hypothetical protein
MKLTRVAACGAAMLSLLAIPGTAMASSPRPPASPVLVSIACPPFRLPPPPSGKPVPVPAYTYSVSAASGVPVKVARLTGCCGPIVYAMRPATQKVYARSLAAWKVYVKSPAARIRCLAQAVVFNMPAGSRFITEVRGPRLEAHQAILYRGRLYTVASVWGSRFTLDYQGKPFVNHGSAIHDGKAAVLGRVFVINCRPVPRAVPRPAPSR